MNIRLTNNQCEILLRVLTCSINERRVTSADAVEVEAMIAELIEERDT